ncbi:DUF86 domain-containing protein [Niallia sp. Krafla_26]|uniref:DUF86 domain-containing protein n=1 Tax=Niallia sp. Krafla_26 TaxID=3064703 RepID=UPI003D1662DC
MYFVDQEKIEEKLVYIDKQIEIFQSGQAWKTDIEKSALERIVHMTIEAILDVGNSMIDGFIMRDPGSYEDIIEILEDEMVITKEMSTSFKHIISYRKPLQQDYVLVNHAELEKAFIQEMPSLKQFSSSIRNYLTKKSGVVTAFKPVE